MPIGGEDFLPVCFTRERKKQNKLVMVTFEGTTLLARVVYEQIANEAQLAQTDRMIWQYILLSVFNLFAIRLKTQIYLMRLTTEIHL